MVRDRTDDIFQPSPVGEGRWLVRPFGPLPFVWELPDEASRSRYARRERQRPGLVIAAGVLGSILGSIAYRGAPASVPSVLAGFLALIGVVALLMRAQLRAARRVPASLWIGATPMERRIAAEPGLATRAVVSGLALAVFFGGTGLFIAVRLGPNTSVAWVTLGVGALSLALTILVWRTARRVRNAERPPHGTGTS